MEAGVGRRIVSLNFLMKVIGLLILDLIDGNRHERRAALRAFQNVMLGVVLLVVVVPTVWKTMPSGTSLEKSRQSNGGARSTVTFYRGGRRA